MSESIEEQAAWPQKTEKRSLPVKLSDLELRERADELAGAQIRLSEIEDEKKSAVSQYKASIDSKQGEIARLSHVIRDRSEQRNIKCEWRFEQSGFDATGQPVWHPEQKTLVRVDTGESVEVRAITDEERQLKLDLDTKAAAEADAEAEKASNLVPFTEEQDPNGTISDL